MEGHVPAGLPPHLRGNYAAAGADFTLPQHPDDYSEADHETWRTLYQRQTALFPHCAARAYREGLARLDCAAGVPDFDRASRRLRAATGFSLVAVPGLIPDGAFFDHLAARRFPVTNWIRKPEELDYLVEPDVFHDFLGHCPLLTNPAFANFMQAYGELGHRAQAMGALKPLARLYWHMVEFGLIREEGAIRAYGAGILSSRAETVAAVTSETPRRVRFDLGRVLRSDYFIDDLQPTYFVIDDYAELFAAVHAAPALLEAARNAEPIPPGAAAPGDIPVPLTELHP